MNKTVNDIYVMCKTPATGVQILTRDIDRRMYELECVNNLLNSKFTNWWQLVSTNISDDEIFDDNEYKSEISIVYCTDDIHIKLDKHQVEQLTGKWLKQQVLDECEAYAEYSVIIEKKYDTLKIKTRESSDKLNKPTVNTCLHTRRVILIASLPTLTVDMMEELCSVQCWMKKGLFNKRDILVIDCEDDKDKINKVCQILDILI